jgi:DNA primase
MNEHRQLKFVFLPDGEDPDSLIRAQGKAGFDNFIDNATPGFEFLFQRLGQGLDLDTVDGQAKFAGLINPFIEKVPAGLLRTLLERRVAQTTGMGSVAGPAATPRPARVSRPDTSNRSVARLSDRLLTYVLKDPRLWTKAAEQTREEVRKSVDQLGLFGQVINYIDENPEAETEELLVHWSDHPQHRQLLAKAERSLEIDAAAIALEFGDGLLRLTEHVRTDLRKQALTALKDSPNDEALRKYWQLHGFGRDYS